MTTAADDPSVEDAFEAFLLGRPVPDEEASLAAFAESVRETATRPGRPNAALAELLATGLLTDQPSPSTRTAPTAGSPRPRGASRIRRRRRFAMIFPALLAKFLSAGAIAQAATGAGVVLVAVTGAGATGVLPDPLQDPVASVVETVTPFDLPGGEETATDEEPALDEPLTDEEPAVEDPAVEGDDEADEEADDVTTEFDAAEWALNGPDEDQTFGAWVSEAARHGGVDGQVVRDWAHRKHVVLEDLDPEELDGVDVDELIEDTTTPAPEVEAETPETETEVATTERGGKGNGSGNAGGNGKAAASGGGNGGGKGNGRN
jgi:hypothetical protein